MKNWVIAGSVVVGLGLVLFLSDRPVKTTGGIDLIRSPNQYAEANNKASQLALGPMQKDAQGQVLTAEDKANLKEATKYFDAMQAFDPRRVQPLFGAGKVYMILGEKEKAAERFQQALNNKDVDPDHDSQAVKLTIVETFGQLSEVTLDLATEEAANFNSFTQSGDKKAAEEAKNRSLIYYRKALDCANRAVEAQPLGTRYLVDRGNILLAIGNKEKAKEDFKKALTLDPNDPRVKMSAKQVGL